MQLRRVSTSRLELTVVAILLAIPVVYVTGAVFPPQLVLLLYPRYSPPPPPKESSRGKAITCEVEKEAQGLLIVEKMRAKEGWYETSTSLQKTRSDDRLTKQDLMSAMIPKRFTIRSRLVLSEVPESSLSPRSSLPNTTSRRLSVSIVLVS